MSAFEHNLKPRQAQAVEALMSEPNIKAAAKKAGVGFATLRRWLEDPIFCEALRAARAKSFERTVAALGAVATLAVEVLRQILSDPDQDANIKLRGAKAALDSMLRSYSLIELDERLKAVELQLRAIEEKR